jgi:hypothetical protein
MLPLEITPAQNPRWWSSFSTATPVLDIYPGALIFDLTLCQADTQMICLG